LHLDALARALADPAGADPRTTRNLAARMWS
jgi:hypothetical protein